MAKTKKEMKEELALSMAEADVDMTRDDLIELLTGYYLNGCEALTDEDVEEYYKDINDEG